MMGGQEVTCEMILNEDLPETNVGQTSGNTLVTRMVINTCSLDHSGCYHYSHCFRCSYLLVQFTAFVFVFTFTCLAAVQFIVVVASLCRCVVIPLHL